MYDIMNTSSTRSTTNKDQVFVVNMQTNLFKVC